MNGMAGVLANIMTTKVREGDYLGEDGLLYCGKCHTPKQIRLAKDSFFGDIPLPVTCRCMQEALDRKAAEAERERHGDCVEALRQEGFSDPMLRRWTFENDNGLCPQMKYARRYVERFAEMERENIGLLCWGPVGVGKSYFAASIANALMEREIPVRMTNFAAILNELGAPHQSRNDVLERLGRYRLLILDDLGVERGTDYALEQVYNVVDSRLRSGMPLIVTTNLTPDDLKHPADTAHARIYDRLLEMCSPICFRGESMRQTHFAEKLARVRKMGE